VMVSDWMVNGNIREFVRANIDADRLELVRFHSGPLPSLVTDNHMATVAARHYQGVGLYA
jgi:hypothetical protein